VTSVKDISVAATFREDLGDVSALAESIKRIGLLHPVVVDPDGNLVAGRRRLEAVKCLGWTEVAVTVIDLDEPLIAQRDENACRKDFTLSEKVAIARAIEAKESVAAKERQAAAGPSAGRGAKRTASDKKTEPVERGESRDKAAKAVNMSMRPQARLAYVERELPRATGRRRTLLSELATQLRQELAGTCSRCGRTLSDPDSLSRGHGPVCRKAIAS